MVPYVQIYLLMTNAGLDMTSTELMEAAKCYTCIPAGMAPYVSLYLLENGGGGGGGGGTGGVLCGESDPVDAPSNACTIFYRTDVVRALGWNGSAWVVLFSEI